MSAAGRIDVHCHSVLPAYRALLTAAALGANVRLPAWSPEAAIAMMDRHAIAASITSLSVPGVHLGDDDRARDGARRCNEEAADIVANHRRLGAFATLPLPNIDLACAEAIHALDVLKLDGVGLLTGYGGKYLGDPVFDPLLSVLDERAAVAHIHPAVHPSTSMVSLGVPNFMLEYPFDTTRAATNMIFADVLDRFPNIKFILSHGGGTLPFLAWRIASIATWQLSQPPESERFLRDNFKTRLTTKHDMITPDFIRSLLARFWYDTALAPDTGAMGALRAIADPSRILFGSDWPYAYETFVGAEIADLSAQPSLDLAAIERGNALTLFPRFATV